jgi:outer membrane lipoprotein-sorting protein
MRKMIGLSMSLILIATSQISMAQEKKAIADPAALIANINKAAADTRSIKSDFIQEKELSFLEDKVTSKGKFYFKKDDLLRWEYTSPYEYTIILNKGRIRVIDDGKSNTFDAASNRMFSEINGIMMGVVNGTALNSDNFQTEYFDTGSHYLLSLVPLAEGMKDFLDRIEISVNKKDYTVDSLRMIEKSGDYTNIIFQNKVLNAEIPDKVFSLD